MFTSVCYLFVVKFRLKMKYDDRKGYRGCDRGRRIKEIRKSGNMWKEGGCLGLTKNKMYAFQESGRKLRMCV